MLAELTDIDQIQRQTRKSFETNSLLPMDGRELNQDKFEVGAYRSLMVGQCKEYMKTAGEKCHSVMTEHFIQKICYGDILNRLKTGDFTGGETSPWWMLLVFIPGASLICHGVMAGLRSKCSVFSEGEYCQKMPSDEVSGRFHLSLENSSSKNGKILVENQKN